MTDKRYSLAFTTGGLYVRESVQLADVYLDSGNWSTVRHKVLSENLLQTRTLNTAKRNCREILTRLKELSFQELEFLVRTNTEEQGYLLWMAVCRRYTFTKKNVRKIYVFFTLSNKPKFACNLG